MVLRRVLACVLLVILLGLHASSLDAANPVPQSPVVTTSTQCFIATADSYTSNQDPDTNYGNDNRLRVASVGDVTVIRYEIYLDFALDAIPDGATVLSADLRLTALASPGGTVTYARAVASNWSESTITWNNDPTVGTFSYDTVVVDSAAGVKTWQVPELVNAWVNGSQTNHGLALVSGGVAAPIAEFYSTEGTLTQRPRLCVEWTEDDVTTDIVIDGIEVTQAVQNLDNDVDLVAGKRTFVRVHAHTTNGQFRTFATLTASYGASRATLHPQNPGAHAVLGPDPDRGVLYESFLFELPSTYTQEGSVYLQASVNSLEGWRPSRYPPETSYANNSMDATVTFETVPRIGLIVYRGTYTLDDNGTDVAYTPPFTDVYQT
ncbi:MAG: DNRLRE domain-containing protein, partial [Anaerolineae bacterium]|nr:DNRLRE domain-containing protein [Anaerolineae bacterium]